MTWQNFMQAVFIPLMFFAVWSAWVLWDRVLIPAWKERSVDRYLMGIGGTLISTSVAIECLLYGLVRWSPPLVWLGNVYALAVWPKFLYILGMILILSCEAPEPDRRKRIRFLLMTGFALLVVGMVLAALEG